jgi:hypothetical protein
MSAWQTKGAQSVRRDALCNLYGVVPAEIMSLRAAEEHEHPPPTVGEHSELSTPGEPRDPALTTLEAHTNDSVRFPSPLQECARGWM